MSGGEMIDLIKIGNFIAEMRKEKNITQSMLAEKLGITDRAISKWERGICLPDAGLMISLCGILGISVNDLLTGEKISMEKTSEVTEKNLVELAAKLGRSNKMLLRAEIIYTTIILLFFIGICCLTETFVDSQNLKIVIIAGSVVLLFICVGFSLFIETKAGYYECKKCGHKYAPETNAVFWAPHMGTTRYMRCPECNKKSWQKKAIN